MIAARLDELVESGDWSTLADVLSNLSSDDAAAASAWYARAGRRTRAAKLAEEWQWRRDLPKTSDPSAVVRLLAVRLAPTAAKAAGWFGWREWWVLHSSEARAAVVRLIASRGPEWCAEFVAASSELPARGQLPHEDELVRVLMPVLACYAIGFPGGNYVAGWIAYYQRLVSQVIGDANQLALPPNKRHKYFTRALVEQPWVEDSGEIRVDNRILGTLSLVDVLSLDPVLDDALSATLARPSGLGAMINGYFRAPADHDWGFASAVAELVARGRLDRERVLTDCLAALTRRDNPSTQRAVAQILTALRVDPAEIVGQLPLLQGILATGHGAVTAVILPLALHLIESADDVDEVSATIFGRSEKKQQSDLLRALLDPAFEQRHGREAVLTGLDRAVTSSDLRLSQRAQTHRRALTPAAAEEIVDAVDAVLVEPGLWDARPEPRTVSRLRPVEPTAAALTRIQSQLTTHLHLTGEAQLLAALVAFARADIVGARTWLAQRDSRQPLPGRVLPLARQWATGEVTPGEYSRLVQLTDRIGEPRGPGRSDVPWRISSLSPMGAFGMLLSWEAMLRLGSAHHLLGTPVFTDGTLDLDTLLGRMRAAGADGYHPVDLFQALLRLEPVPVERADEARRISLRNRSVLRGKKAPIFGRASDDAGKILARWIEGGGARYPEAVTEGGWLRAPAITLPVPVAEFAGVPRTLVAGWPLPNTEMYWWNIEESDLVVLPRSAETFSAAIEHHLIGSKMSVAWVSEIARIGRAGRGVHTVIARTISHADANSRLVGADALTTLIARGEFRGDLFTRVCTDLLGRGEFPLARTATSVEQVILAGGMSDVWPSVLAIAIAAIQSEKRPAGLAEWLGLVRRFSPAAPDQSVPEAIKDLAGRGGSTKAAVEARAILAQQGVPA